MAENTAAGLTPSPLVKAAPLTWLDHVVNVIKLVIKELRSIRADPTMLVLVVYAFSISVNTVATGAVTDATNMSVGIVDEDGSALSRQIAEALLRPTFQPAVHISANEIDSSMDRGDFLFVVEVPPNFEADLRAQRKTQLQINIDATIVAQAGNGANYLKTAISNEIQSFLSGTTAAKSSPINLVVRTDFNPNLVTSWFSAMTQVINQITLLTVILTGAALIREREQGTVEHLLVMPVVPAEIMLAKMLANGLVILVAAMLSLQFVVHWWIGSPIAGSRLLFLLGAAEYALVVAALGILLGTLATTMGQFGLLAMPVLMVTQLLSGSSTPMESMPVWLQYVVKTVSPTPHFVSFSQAVLFRGADLSLVWQPLLAMFAIGSVYFIFALSRFRRVIFGS
ncbi:ABC transporter permease [Bradyrhizobium sp.]|uniref:ABC transporter permease n=1 Tax=Bradyrhizobium sp. TaxID=376 RepID=UPI00238F832C|nr:ABC transporter permease [Bradyrhizobium sp.]MDE1936709.1 ABC transporter permease [Bradyrhizobium sp.]